MDNFDATIVTIAFSVLEPVEGGPINIFAYIGGALNILLFLYSVKKIFGKNVHTAQILCALLASLLGGICSIVFFTVKVKYTASFIALNSLYHSLVWISFMSIFPFWARKLRSSGVKTYPLVARILALIACLYALIAIILSIVAGARYYRSIDDYNMNKTGTNNSYISDYNNRDREGIDRPLLQHMSFMYYSNYAYVAITLVLFGVFLRDVIKVSSRIMISAIAFFVFATIAVVTETATTVHRDGLVYNHPVLLLTLNFVLIHLFNIIALFIVLKSSNNCYTAFDGYKIAEEASSV